MMTTSIIYVKLYGTFVIFYRGQLRRILVKPQARESGAQSATERAHGLYKDILARFEPPPLDPAIADDGQGGNQTIFSKTVDPIFNIR